MTHDRWFKEYVLHYTNAATLIQEGFQDTEDLDGLFSGLDPETGVYDVVSGHWGYEGSLGDRDEQDGRHESVGPIRPPRRSSRRSTARGSTATPSMAGPGRTTCRGRR